MFWKGDTLATPSNAQSNRRATRTTGHRGEIKRPQTREVVAKALAVIGLGMHPSAPATPATACPRRSRRPLPVGLMLLITSRRDAAAPDRHDHAVPARAR